MTRKIIHVISTIERGGAEKQLLILVEEQVKSGMAVEVLYLKGNPELSRQIQDVGGVVNSEISNLNFVKQLILLKRFLRREQATIHAHLPKSELLVALSCSNSHFVITRHNAEQFWPKAPSFISRWISRLITSRAFAVIAISKAVSNFLYTQREVSPHCRVTVIHYGFPNMRELGSKKNLSVSLFRDSPKDELKIGTIGRLVAQKDYPTLLRGFQLALNLEPNMHLYIVGEGELRNELKILAQTLGVSGKVSWLGKIELIDEFLSKLDLFILSSIYEGFGMVILEAMSNHVPILASNISAIPEVLGFDYPGLFPSGDPTQLATLITQSLNKDFRKNLISNYAEQMELFSPQKMTEKISSVYEAMRFKNLTRVK